MAILDLLTEDALSLLAGVIQLPWGIYFNGIPVVVADTVTKFDFQQGYQISTFPVEQGKFASYNKVYQPFQAKFRFAAGDTEIRRQALLASIKAIVGNANIYDIVTPDSVYLGVNVVNFDYSQTATDGVGLLSVDVGVEQVLEATSVALSAVQSPSSASQVNGGPVQPVPATAAQTATLPLIDGVPLF